MSSGVQRQAMDVVFNVRRPGGSSLTQKLRCITVEPVLFFFMFGLGINYPALHALLYKKVCLQRFADNVTICDNLHQSDHKEYEDEVQTDASHWLLYEHLAFEIPSVLMSFFYGSLSDHVGRKMTLLLPTIGQAISMANYIIQSVHMDYHVGYILIGRLISGVFGGWIGCCLSSFSYLSAVTSSETRTVRISLAEGCISISIAISFLISGVILDSTSFQFVFGLACAVNMVATVYVLVWIKEPEKDRPVLLGAGEAVTVCNQMWARVKQSVTCVFQKRENKKRKHMLVLLLALLLGMISYNAMYTLGYLYLRRQPLSWSQTTYGVLVGTRTLVSGTCLFTVVPFLVKKCHLPDTALILIALVSSTIGEAYFGICTKTWMVFMLPILSCMSDAKLTCMRSQLSQFVEPDEYGRMFAAVGFLQSVSGILGTLLYNNLYPLTLDVWPGLCFLLGAIITIIPIGLVSWLHFDLKNEVAFTELAEEREDPSYGSADVRRGRRRSSSKSGPDTEHSPLKSTLNIFAIYNNPGDTGPDYRNRLRIPSAVF